MTRPARIGITCFGVVFALLAFSGSADASRVDPRRPSRVYATSGDAGYPNIVYVEVMSGAAGGLEVMLTPAGMTRALSRQGALDTARDAASLYARIPLAQRSTYRAIDWAVPALAVELKCHAFGFRSPGWWDAFGFSRYSANPANPTWARLRSGGRTPCQWAYLFT